MIASFDLNRQRFVALHGGPHFHFTPAISLVVNCDSQQEIDAYWDKLSAGGEPKAQQCGWLADKYGLSWQIVPAILPTLLEGGSEKSNRVMKALMPMKKLDIETLKRASEGA